MPANKQRNINFGEKFRISKEQVIDILMFVLLVTAIMLLALAL